MVDIAGGGGARQPVRQRLRAGAEVDEARAIAYVIRALEGTGCATRADFNLDAIIGVSYAVADGWDFDRIEPEIFWRIAAEFIR